MTWWMLVLIAVWAVGVLALVLTVRETEDDGYETSAFDGLALLLWPLTASVLALATALSWIGRGGRGRRR